MILAVGNSSHEGWDIRQVEKSDKASVAYVIGANQ